MVQKDEKSAMREDEKSFERDVLVVSAMRDSDGVAACAG